MANLVIPEVFGKMTRENFKGKVKVANLAVDLGELPQFSEVGNTITFPKFKLIGDVEEVKKGTPISTEDLQQTSSQATIKQIGKGVKVYDIDDLTAFGNHVDEASRQEGMVFARKLDSDLITEALTSPLKSACANAKAITADEINKGLLLFADEQDTDEMAGIVVHSLVASSFYNMNEFVTARTDTMDGNGIVRNGCIGFFRGIPVFMSDKDTYDSVKGECVSLIIKKGALGYKEKRGINIEVERDASLKCNNVYGDYIYAVKLINDAGVVVLRKTIA